MGGGSITARLQQEPYRPCTPDLLINLRQRSKKNILPIICPFISCILYMFFSYLFSPDVLLIFFKRFFWSNILSDSQDVWFFFCNIILFFGFWRGKKIGSYKCYFWTNKKYLKKLQHAWKALFCLKREIALGQRPKHSAEAKSLPG